MKIFLDLNVSGAFSNVKDLLGENFFPYNLKIGNNREAHYKPHGSPSMFLSLYLVKAPVGRMTQEIFKTSEKTILFFR
jgi:hypothetical protein